MSLPNETELFTAPGIWAKPGDTVDDIAAPDLSYADGGGDYRRDGFDESQAFTPRTPGTDELHAGHFVGLLWAIAQPVQGWAPFRESVVGNIAAGSVILAVRPVRPGWEWQINRVAVSVTGASAAATVALYVGPEFGETAAPDESYLVDFASAMLGNSPSRQISTPNQPYYLNEQDQLAVVIASAAGAGQAFARVEGVRRQKP